MNCASRPALSASVPARSCKAADFIVFWLAVYLPVSGKAHYHFPVQSLPLVFPTSHIGDEAAYSWALSNGLEMRTWNASVTHLPAQKTFDFLHKINHLATSDISLFWGSSLYAMVVDLTWHLASDTQMLLALVASGSC